MQVIIFEGIATSGKTTLIERLSNYLIKQDLQVQSISEDDTLLPIIDNKDPSVAKKFILDFISWVFDANADFLLVDRFYFTHIFRTKSNLEEFSDIEQNLLDNTTVVFLKVAEDNIQERLEEAVKVRDEEWNTYFRKQGPMAKAVSYYKDQQIQLEKISKESALNVITLDVSMHTVEQSFLQLVELLDLNKKDL